MHKQETFNEKRGIVSQCDAKDAFKTSQNESLFISQRKYAPKLFASRSLRSHLLLLVLSFASSVENEISHFSHLAVAAYVNEKFEKVLMCFRINKNFFLFFSFSTLVSFGVHGSSRQRDSDEV